MGQTIGCGHPWRKQPTEKEDSQEQITSWVLIESLPKSQEKFVSWLHLLLPPFQQIQSKSKGFVEKQIAATCVAFAEGIWGMHLSKGPSSLSPLWEQCCRHNNVYCTSSWQQHVEVFPLSNYMRVYKGMTRLRKSKPDDLYVPFLLLQLGV